MNRRPNLLRTALAIAAGLLLALAAEAPAAAATIPFDVHDVGEDYCTYYDATGQAVWPEPDDFATEGVAITGQGEQSSAPPGTICLGIEPYPRHLAFVAYVGDEPVDTHAEPFDHLDDGGPMGGGFVFAFTLADPEGAAIDSVTVAICHREYDPIGSGIVCDDPVVLKPGTRS